MDIQTNPVFRKLRAEDIPTSRQEVRVQPLVTSEQRVREIAREELEKAWSKATTLLR